MNNILNVIIFLFLFVVTAYSQNQEPEAKLLLQKVNSKINTYDNIQILFKYSLENEEENLSQETNGKVSLKKDKFVLEIFGIKQIFDGNKLHNISLEDEEVTISRFENNDKNTISPNNLFSFFNNGFNYKLDIQQKKHSSIIQYIKLTPIDSESEIKYILLGIEKKTKHIYNLIEIGKNKTKSTLTVTSFDYNLPINDSAFTFKSSEYPNFYINKID